MAKDISSMLGGINLEKSALDKFGAAVDNKADKLSFGARPDQATAKNPGEHNVWESSNYATALVKTNTVPFQPKLKFMFKVSFKFDPGMIDLATKMGHDLKTLQENVTFLVRHVDRPKHDMDYEEVNMYNFRTHILKSIKNREVGLTIYDDVGNNALSFVNVYRKLLQPIARTELMPMLAHEDSGLDFTSDASTSSRNVLPNGAKNVLTEMRIHQIFVERGSDVGDPSSWVKVVNFVFMNPKFVSIDIDDLDHEGNSINVVTFSIHYDNVFIDHAKPFNEENGGPSLPVGDIAQDSKATSSQQGGGTNGISPQNFDSFDMPSFNNVDSMLAGGGDISPPGGALQEAGSKSIKDMITGKLPTLSKPSIPTITDNTVAPSLANLNVSRFKNGGLV